MFVGIRIKKRGFAYNEEYKKIALRFLKETGLLNHWRKYVSRGEHCSEYDGEDTQLNASNWYRVAYIDRVFGRTNFTCYLKDKCDCNISGYSISDLFRAYLRKYYPEQYEYKCPSYIASYVREAIERAGTFNVMEFQKYIK